MAVMKLIPSYKDYIWGGHRLVEEYHKQYDGEILAESWELSCHPDGPVKIANGTYAGKTLSEYIQICGKSVLGKNSRRFQDFPILIKFIDAKDNLSIQVHPSNSYALKHEGQFGKTEMWYVTDCKEGAYLYYGFSREIDKEEFARRIKENTLLEVLNKVPVQKGDVLFIEAGTIHAIGKDIVIAEIQQNSNVTYRVYDYGRVDKNGKTRDLHIEKALAVTNRVPIIKSKSCNPHIAKCDYFTVDKLNLDGKIMRKVCGTVSEDSFVHLLILEGSGTVRCGEETILFQKGDSLFLPAESGEYEVTGVCEALVTSIGEKASPMRIGIDVGGTNTKIGIVDADQNLTVCKEIPTRTDCSYQETIREIGEHVTRLMEDQKIPLDNCVGVGVGIPGTIDKAEGIVRYSNNIGWENVPFADELKKYLQVPIRIANDADCAALGEVVKGAARNYSDVVLLTLGTGVGGGIVLDGNIYEGKLVGGSELGHTVICVDGEPCTCGRKGCLEAYVSATALVRDTRRKMQINMDSLLWKLCNNDIEKVSSAMLFDAAEQGDPTACEIVDQFTKYLTDGIVNIINIFRPELILLGGGVSNGGSNMVEKINKNLAGQCFAGKYGNIPDVRIAALGNQAGMIGAANLV